MPGGSAGKPSGQVRLVFFVDLLAVPTNLGDNEDEALSRGTQASSTLDPSLVTASIAAITRHRGVAITKSTTYFHPVEVARIFATSTISAAAGLPGTS